MIFVRVNILIGCFLLLGKGLDILFCSLNLLFDALNFIILLVNGRC